MASTPSASALSAVLRCRRNIWTRNSPTKRPAASAYSLGLSGGAGRDSAAERSRSKQGSSSPQLCQQDVNNTEDNVLQVNGQVSCPTDLTDENETTEDRPD